MIRLFIYWYDILHSFRYWLCSSPEHSGTLLSPVVSQFMKIRWWHLECTCTAPCPGIVTRILAKVGQFVYQGDLIIIIKIQTKMTDIKATCMILCSMWWRRLERIFGRIRTGFRLIPCETWHCTIGRSMSHYLSAMDIYAGATSVSGLRSVLRRIYPCY